jgi:hypothetical protein
MGLENILFIRAQVALDTAASLNNEQTTLLADSVYAKRHRRLSSLLLDTYEYHSRLNLKDCIRDFHFLNSINGS